MEPSFEGGGEELQVPGSKVGRASDLKPCAELPSQLYTEGRRRAPKKSWFRLGIRILQSSFTSCAFSTVSSLPPLRGHGGKSEQAPSQNHEFTDADVAPKPVRGRGGADIALFQRRSEESNNTVM